MTTVALILGIIICERKSIINMVANKNPLQVTFWLIMFILGTVALLIMEHMQSAAGLAGIHFFLNSTLFIKILAVIMVTMAAYFVCQRAVDHIDINAQSN